MRGIEDFKGYQTQVVYNQQTHSFRTVTLSPLFPAMKKRRPKVMASKAHRPMIAHDLENAGVEAQDQQIEVLHSSDDLRRLNV